MASLAAKSAYRADAARVEIEAGDAAGDATDDGVRAAAALVLRRLADDLRVIRAAADETDEGGEGCGVGGEGYGAATPNLAVAVADVDAAAELVAENASLRRALALAARTGVDGDGGDAEMAAARRESTRREADFAKMRETLARRDSENARLRASLEAATGSAAAAGRSSSSPGSSPGRSPPHAAALEPPGPGEQLHAARRLEVGAALTLDRLEDLEAELEILREWKDSAEEELRGTHERLAEATEANHHLELRAIAAEAAAERLHRPDVDVDVDVDGEGAREDRPATTAYALSLPPIGEEESLHLLELPGDEDEPPTGTRPSRRRRRSAASARTRRPGPGRRLRSLTLVGRCWRCGRSSNAWGSHETLRARYAQQTRRLRRARETVLALSEGAMDVDVGVSGSLASLSLSLPPPGLADSARSSVVTGELSEDDVDADEWTRAAGHAGHAGHAGRDAVSSFEAQPRGVFRDGGG